MRIHLLSRPVPEKGLVRGERENLFNRNFGIKPLENKCASRSQDSEALRKSGVEHVAPFREQTPVSFRNIAPVGAPQSLRRVMRWIKHH